MLKHLDLRTYEYQTEFARRAFSQGRAEGRTEMILRLLTSRFGALSSEMETRIRRTSIDELNAIGDRLLSAPTLHDALNGAPALPGDECSDT